MMPIENSEPTILSGDRNDALASLPENSFHACIFQPPDYCANRDGHYDSYVARIAHDLVLAGRATRDDGAMWLISSDPCYAIPERKTVRVKLSENEISMVEMIAHQRNDPKEAAGVKRNMPEVADATGATELGLHLIGVGAEVAVAKLYGVMPSFYVSLCGDKGVPDLVIMGKKVEVKCRAKEGYDFALTSSDPEDFDADVGVLVYVVEHGTYDVWGVISKERFQARAKLVDYGYGARAAVGPEEFADSTALSYFPGELMSTAGNVTSLMVGFGWRATKRFYWMPKGGRTLFTSTMFSGPGKRYFDESFFDRESISDEHTRQYYPRIVCASTCSGGCCSVCGMQWSGARVGEWSKNCECDPSPSEWEVYRLGTEKPVYKPSPCSVLLLDEELGERSEAITKTGRNCTVIKQHMKGLG